MKSTNSKSLQYLHLTLGIFFVIAGIVTLQKSDYLYSIWVIALGLFFLFDMIQKAFLVGLNQKTQKAIHYALAAIVLAMGLITLFR
jgi:hypothetical protein